jgi:hypothetical protein
MPNGTFVDLPPEKQAQMLAALRCARYGYLLGPPGVVAVCSRPHARGNCGLPVLLPLQCVPHGV